MSGVRIVEVAEHTFVPAASALLADLGADVIKIEPVERGDAVRGLSGSGNADVHLMHEHSNRGKRSLALDLGDPDGVGLLYRLCETADVFITNKVGRIRRKLRIDVDDLRAHNRDLIYVRGTGQGERGSEADRGSYDLLNFWHRSGASTGAASPTGDIPFLPAPGFGDSISAMTIAGGTLGALYHRERTGEASIVDVSLLSTGMWAMGAAIAMAAVMDGWRWPPAIPNPLSRIYETRDGRRIALCCLQPTRYWAELCKCLDRPELSVDVRFADHEVLFANSAEAIGLLADVFRERTLEEWCSRLASFTGQWTVVQDARQASVDQQALANGYLQSCTTAAGVPFTLVAGPVQFDEEPARPARAPAFNEHGDAIMAELGLDWDRIIELKTRGVVA